MNDIVDQAYMHVISRNTPPPVVRIRTWKILVELGDTWSELDEVTGSAVEAADVVEEFIDLKHGRWARGYDNKCIAASDGVAEEAWYKAFGTN